MTKYLTTWLQLRDAMDSKLEQVMSQKEWLMMQEVLEYGGVHPNFDDNDVEEACRMLVRLRKILDKPDSEIMA